MNLFDTLKRLQDFRSQLEVWGITSTYLWAAGAVALFFWILSTREVLGWYLRTNQLRDEVKELRFLIQNLQSSIERIEKSTKPEGEEPDKAGSKSFRLDHWRNSL